MNWMSVRTVDKLVMHVSCLYGIMEQNDWDRGRGGCLAIYMVSSLFSFGFLVPSFSYGCCVLALNVVFVRITSLCLLTGFILG